MLIKASQFGSWAGKTSQLHKQGIDFGSNETCDGIYLPCQLDYLKVDNLTRTRLPSANIRIKPQNEFPGKVHDSGKRDAG